MWKIGHLKKTAQTNEIGNVKTLGYPYEPETEIIFCEGDKAIPIYLPGFDVKAPFEGRVLTPNEFSLIIDTDTISDHPDQKQAEQAWQEHYFEGQASRFYERKK